MPTGLQDHALNIERIQQWLPNSNDSKGLMKSTCNDNFVHSNDDDDL